MSVSMLLGNYSISLCLYRSNVSILFTLASFLFNRLAVLDSHFVHDLMVTTTVIMYNVVQTWPESRMIDMMKF